MKMLRCRGLILSLLLAFLAGNLGLPLADAIIFHGQPGASPAAERLLSRGPQGSGHQQICSLEQTPPATFATLSFAIGIERLPADDPAVRRPEPTTVRCGEPILALHSRAPPSA